MRKPKAARPLSHFVRSEAHGETGDGKTQFASTFPGPKLWLDPTHGCDHFLKDHVEACPYLLGTGDCLGPTDCGGDFVDNTINPDDYYEVLEWGIAAAHKGLIRTIVLDDQSVMQDRFVLSVVEDPDAKVPIDDWAKIKRPLNRILNKIAAAPVHLIITSRASMVAVEDGGAKIDVRKAARPKVWDDFIYPCDFAFYLYTMGTELAAGKYKYKAMVQKSRVKGVPSLKQGAVVDNPTFDSIFADLLKREAGLPLPEYDDPDALTKGGGTTAALANEEQFRAALAAIKAATNMEQLGAAWTPVAKSIQAGEFAKPQQEALVEQKNKTKATFVPAKS